MAKANSTPRLVPEEPDSIFPDDVLPHILFAPLEYGWSHEASKHVHGVLAIQLAKHARAVAKGTALLMQINERDGFEAMTDAPEPIFNDYHRGQLEHLVWAAADMLVLEADTLLNDAERKLTASRDVLAPEGGAA